MRPGIAGADALPLWQKVADGSPAMLALVEAVAATDVSDVGALAHLRKYGDADLVAVAIELVRARAKAQRKFANGATLIADVAGVEQATGTAVAAHKARRFASCLPPGAPVVDLCCGIGGDAMALAVVAEVTAIDVHPLRAWMTGRNAGCATRVADVEAIDTGGAVFHLDPARRDEKQSRRIKRYADYVPGPAYIDRLLAAYPDGAIKLGPGVEFDALPLGPDREVEIIAERGALVQAVLWCGRLAQNGGRRTATSLPEGRSVSAAPAPLMTGDGFGRYLMLVDPAVERAGLAGALCRDLPVREAHAGLGILTSDEPVDSPWLTSHVVLAQMPWRTKRIAQWLSEHDGGIVTVRTRDKTIDCDEAQVQLRGAGSRPFTMFGLRLGRRVVAIITAG